MILKLNRIRPLPLVALVTFIHLAIFSFFQANCAFAKTIKVKPIKDAATENKVIQLYKQARALYKSGNKVTARLVLLKAIKYDQTAMSPYLHKLLAQIYYEIKNPEKACDHALKSLKYNPSQEKLILNLAIYAKEANKYTESIAFLRYYLEKITSGKEKDQIRRLISDLQVQKAKASQFRPDSPDYLDKLTYEDNVHRWAKSKFPLKVYIQNSSTAHGFKPIFADLVKESFVAWYKASDRKTPFKFLSQTEKSKADITLVWTDKRLRSTNDKKERLKAGLTTSQTTLSGEIKSAIIQIRTLNPFSKKAITEDRIKSTCLHEIGHALGLNGHSTNHSDIMYMGTAKRQLPALTKRDQATIKKLYESYRTIKMAGIPASKTKKQSTAAVIQTKPQNSKDALLPSFATKPPANTSNQNMAAIPGLTPQQIPQQRPYPNYYQQPQRPYYQPGYYPPGNVVQYQPRIQPTPQYAVPYYVYTPVQTPYVMPAQPGTYQQPVIVQPQTNYNYSYAPPVIPRQQATPYPNGQVYPRQSPPPAMQQPAQSNQNPVNMIDNVFQNLKPKIQQFLNSPVQQPVQQQQQYPYQ